MYNRDLMESSMGFGGLEFANDTAVHNAPASDKPFIAITIVTAATFSAITVDPSSPLSGNTFTGVALPVGMTIYGRFKSFTLTSGSVVAYKAALPL